MKLFCRRYGDGPPLIILHGLYGSSDNWVTIAKIISNKFTVYLPDQRNHGQSPHSEVHDYDSMSSDLFELISDLGLTKFFLAGHSMGGKTAICFALRWPEMIDGLLIADISPFTDESIKPVVFNQHQTILKTILETDLTKVSSRHEAEILLSYKISSGKILSLIMKNLQRLTDNRFAWKINTSSLIKNLENIMVGLPRPSVEYQQVTGFPVIFLKGENSDYLSPSDYKDILKMFPSAEFRTVKNSGHWLHSDTPEAVAEALISLLNDK
jgi:esterase